MSVSYNFDVAYDSRLDYSGARGQLWDAWGANWTDAWSGSWGLTWEAAQDLLVGSGGPDASTAAQPGRSRENEERLQLEHLEREREHKARLYSTEQVLLDSPPAGATPAVSLPSPDTPPPVEEAAFILDASELVIAANDVTLLANQLSSLKLRRDEEEALLLILAEAA